MRRPFHLSVLLGLALLLLTACASSRATATEVEASTEQREPSTQEPSVVPSASPQPGRSEVTPEALGALPSPTEVAIQQAGCEDADPKPGPNEIVITGAVCLRYPIGRTTVDEWAGDGYYGIELDIEAEPADPLFADGVIIWIPPGTRPGTYSIGTDEYEEGVEKINAKFSYTESGTRYNFESLDGSIQLAATGDPDSGAVFSGSFTFTAVAVDFWGTDPSKTISVTGNFDFLDN